MSLPEILDWYEYCEFLLVSSLLTVATMVIITQGKIHIMNVWPTLGNHHTTSPYYTTVTFELSKSQIWSAPKSQERAILSMFKVQRGWQQQQRQPKCQSCRSIKEDWSEEAAPRRRFVTEERRALWLSARGFLTPERLVQRLVLNVTAFPISNCDSRLHCIL